MSAPIVDDAYLAWLDALAGDATAGSFTLASAFKEWMPILVAEVRRLKSEKERLWSELKEAQRIDECRRAEIAKRDEEIGRLMYQAGLK